MRRIIAFIAAGTLAVTFALPTITRPAVAVGGEDCPAFARAVQVSVRKGNATFPNAYRNYLGRGISKTRATSIATGDANSAFWRSLVIQSRAIADYSTDAVLFLDVHTIARARSQNEVGRAFGRAMNSCRLTLRGNYPNQTVIARR